MSQKDLIEKTLPRNSDEIKIEQDLFSWRLYSGKEVVECRSEEEARYLKVFLEAGMRTIRIPKDEDYLKAILPELEDLKARIDEIINSYLDTVMSRKIREQVRREVWEELLK
ncbi:MAG: hypothetical protein ONB05_06310 [candidate division KSB1 bacterium]|nr:hypothetical protein [candidate division KSB1 bacterium]